MKKTYITPESLTVVLGTIYMTANTTLPLNDDEETDDSEEWLTKENKSVWSDEW